MAAIAASRHPPAGVGRPPAGARRCILAVSPLALVTISCPAIGARHRCRLVVRPSKLADAAASSLSAHRSSPPPPRRCATIRDHHRCRLLVVRPSELADAAAHCPPAGARHHRRLVVIRPPKQALPPEPIEPAFPMFPLPGCAPVLPTCPSTSSSSSSSTATRVCQ